MREEIANLVYPVMTYGLRLKDRLARGERPSLKAEQSQLIALLKSEDEARRWPDYGREAMSAPRPSLGGGGMSSGLGNVADRVSGYFLGIRYALTCWLDELFTVDSPWAREWNEQKLETALYRTTDRAWSFWVQAKLAEARTDAPDVFFLLTMLGFRGEMREQLAELDAMMRDSEKRIVRGLRSEYEVVDRGRPPCNVPLLVGRQKLQRMVLILAGLLLLVVPFAAYLVVNYLLPQS